MHNKFLVKILNLFYGLLYIKIKDEKYGML